MSLANVGKSFDYTVARAVLPIQISQKHDFLVRQEAQFVERMLVPCMPTTE
jgi:hypothetical protein